VSDGHDATRFLLVSQPSDAGVAACVLAIAAALRDRGSCVTVACDPDGQLHSRLVDRGIATIAFAARRGPHPSDIGAVLRLRRHLRACDVVFLHSTKAGLLGRIAAIGTRTGVVYAPHGWAFLMRTPLRGVYLLVERLLSRRADVIVAVSTQEAEVASRLGRSATSRIVVINNGVDVDRFTPGPTVTGEPSIVCIGRLCEQKGQDLLLRAVGGHSIDAPVVLVGDGPDRDKLERLAAELGVNAMFVGTASDVVPYLQSAAIACVPSRWDGLSLGLLEAMACGKPIVATAVTGADALGECGVLVPPDDVDALANALRALLDDPDGAAALGRRARARAQAEFSSERWLRETAAVLDGLAHAP
jgi:glycosyltransferase involved in cell wall biosynthesis